MAVSIRAMLHLKPGARLYYACPMMSMEDASSDRFFRKYHGKYATFVSYCEDLVGLLDRHGRPPGRYVNGEFFNARFDGEEELQRLKYIHCILIDPANAVLAKSFDEDDRLGDLPFPLLFYPGDLVMYREKADQLDLIEKGPYTIAEVPQIPLLGDRGSIVLNEEKKPRYRLTESDREYEERMVKCSPPEEKENASMGEIFARVSRSMREEERKAWYAEANQLRLVSRGNVWALYHDPKWLTFASDEEELAFWAQEGVSRKTTDSIYPGISFKNAWELFVSRAADVIVLSSIAQRSLQRAQERGETEEPKYFAASRLHDGFSVHCERVRALTQKIWADRAKQLAQTGS